MIKSSHCQLSPNYHSHKTLPLLTSPICTVGGFANTEMFAIGNQLCTKNPAKISKLRARPQYQLSFDIHSHKFYAKFAYDLPLSLLRLILSLIFPSRARPKYQLSYGWRSAPAVLERLHPCRTNGRHGNWTSHLCFNISMKEQMIVPDWYNMNWQYKRKTVKTIFSNENRIKFWLRITKSG